MNALDAVSNGGRIEVAVSALDEQVIIEVTDDGRGLPAELGQRIFDPFVSKTETGLGLGLSICRRIVEAHDASLAARSRPEGGSQFRVELPQSLHSSAPSAARAKRDITASLVSR